MQFSFITINNLWNNEKYSVAIINTHVLSALVIIVAVDVMIIETL
jgi:hypothetical protein